MVFLDAGDRLLPGTLEVGVGCLESRPQRAFVSGRYRGSSLTACLFRVPRRPRVERHHSAELLRANYIGMHVTVMYRRSGFESVGGFDTSL